MIRRTPEFPRTSFREFARDAPEAVEGLEQLDAAASRLGIDPVLIELVNVRVSRLNGCEHCKTTHEAELRKLGTSVERVAALRDWRSSTLYTNRECAALEWVEAVSSLDGRVPDAIWRRARAEFSVAELTGLTIAIGAIEVWNRLVIALRLSEAQTRSDSA